MKQNIETILGNIIKEANQIATQLVTEELPECESDFMRGQRDILNNSAKMLQQGLVPFNTVVQQLEAIRNDGGFYEYGRFLSAKEIAKALRGAAD